MKKFISVLFSCSVVLLTLTACMGYEEKQQARENEKLAKSVIERYVERNYSGATIKDIVCLTNTSASFAVATFSTDYVKAKVLHNGESFEVAVGLETKEIFENSKQQKITEELESLLLNSVSVEKPLDIEIKYAPKDLISHTDGEVGGLADKSVDSAEDLLSSDNYKIYIICKYAESDMDFEAISVKSFFKDGYKSDIEIAFLNYRSATRYDGSDVIRSNFTTSSYNEDFSCFLSLDDEDDYYNINAIKMATQYNEDSYNSDGEKITELIYNEAYRHYKSQTFNDILFIWDDECYDIDFSEIDAQNVVLGDYSRRFYATESKAVKLDCTKNTDEIFECENKVYMYTDDKRGEYMVTKSNGKIHSTKLDEKKKEYACACETLQDDSHKITLGFYRRNEEF